MRLPLAVVLLPLQEARSISKAVAVPLVSGVWAGGATLTSCIVWGNEGSASMEGSGAFITYSNIEGGYAGVGNINVDPLFVDPLNGNYHLAAGSPCLDAGDPAFEAGEGGVDMDGHPRVMGAKVDMGADEVHSPDVNGSGAVDGADAGLLFAAWGPCPELCAADLNADGVVDGADLGQLLSAWTF